MGGGRIVSSLPSSHDSIFGFHAGKAWDSCGLHLIGAVGTCAASVRSRHRCGRAGCEWGLESMDVDCMDAGACTYVSKQECR